MFDTLVYYINVLTSVHFNIVYL